MEGGRGGEGAVVKWREGEGVVVERMVEGGWKGGVIESREGGRMGEM